MRRSVGLQVMSGAPVAGRFLAHAIFWILLGYGALWGELKTVRILVFVVIWLAVFLGVPRLIFDPYAMVAASLVAFLDIVLIVTIFKGDIRLT